MKFTTLRIGNSGIWRQGWYTDDANKNSFIVPNPTFIEYANVLSLGVDIGNSTTLKELTMLGECNEHPKTRS
eukprot:5723636-Ditylum_brightwellii.AAC.1